MSLIFKNDTSFPLWVAFAHAEKSCTGSKWRKEGWYKINPRGTRTVWYGSTKNRKFYYFAHSPGYKYTWSGNIHTDLPSYPFSRCWDEPGGTNRGMRVIWAPADRDTYTQPLYI